MTNTLTQKLRIAFFHRAYNDTDIQLSLIDAFAEDPNYDVHVLGYPCDGFIGAPQKHEAAPYLGKLGVTVGTVLDGPSYPTSIRLFYKAEQFFLSQRKERQKAIRSLMKFFHLFFLHLLKYSLQKTQKADIAFIEGLNADIVVTDEAIAQKGRSHFLDALKKRHSGLLYTVLTGQNIYFDPKPNKSGTNIPDEDYIQTRAKRFFVPGTLDKQICKVFFKNEKFEVAGNLRMDSNWIRKLDCLVLDEQNFPKEKHLAQLPEKGIKVVMMLSKIGYGVNLDNMKATIRRLAAMENVSLVIKPHTRGMKFDFMDEKEVKKVHVSYDTPSAILVEWSDLLLFTGSGIAFHAIVSGKAVGLLSYCKSIDTIFDDGKSCNVFQSLDEVAAFIRSWPNVKIAKASE